jgi:hypothetical protein
MRGQAVYLVAALAAAALTLTATASAQPRAAAASRLQIAIHEQGTQKMNVHDWTYGAFTVDLALPGFASSGKTRISAGPGPTKYVDGQQQIPFGGQDTLTSSKGQLVITFSGTHFPVNNRATSGGIAVGPAAEYGTWTITSATGVYQGWKGGGRFASAIYGYSLNQPYSVEWDGYITR